MGKILPIVNVALAAIAMIVSIIVLLQVMGIKSSLENPIDANVDAETGETAVIPLSQLEEFNMTESFLLSPERLEKPDAKINVVLGIGFAIDKENEGVEATRTALTDSSTIIASRIQMILENKDISYFEDEIKKEELRQEILALVQGLIGNDAITEVYFIKPIISEK